MKKIIFLFIFLFPYAAFSQEDSLLNLLKTTKDSAKIEIFLQLGDRFSNNEPEKGLNYYREGLAYSKEIKNKKGEINSLEAISNIYNTQGNANRADSCLRTALVIAQQTKDSSSIGTIYSNIGLAYFNRENYDTALQFYFVGLRIFEKINSKKKIGSVLNNIANAYYVAKDLKKALDYNLKSLAISRELNAPSKIASSLNNLGMIYRDQRNFPEALKSFNEALDLAKKTNHKFGQSLLLNNIGKCYVEQGHYSQAISCFEETLKLKIELNDQKGAGNTYVNLAEAYFHLKNYDKALENNFKCIELSKKLNSSGLLSNAYQNLSNVFYEKQDFKNAYLYKSLYITIQDSLQNMERSAQITEMDAKYQSEKKDKAILQQHAELKVKESENKQKETQRNAIFIGFILLGILAIVIFKNLRNKQKANLKLSEAYEVIELKNQIVEEKNKNITDSINYAKRIQTALLASSSLLDRNLSDYFIFYKPKDIVSGDFYWAHQSENSFLLCTADCTGHGVPGAFMSLLGVSALNEIVNENKIIQPNKVLDQLREKIILVLNPEGAIQKSYEGMDCSFCKYDFNNKELCFSTANNGVWIVRAGELIEFKGERQPVGFHLGAHPFSVASESLKSGDCIYTYTDGFADQFGGEKGKKFKQKALQQLLKANANKPMAEQKTILETALTAWKGDFEQVDDILVIGIRIS